MPFLTSTAHRLSAVARYLEHPKLYVLRRRQVLLDTFEKLDQPWFHALNIKTVLDIGANTGQFARTIMAVLPDVHIYAFEPLPDCFQQLQAHLGQAQKFTAFNVGLGEQSGKLSFERNVYSPSSSFLKMTEQHREAFPYTRDSHQVTVKVECLDDLAKNLMITEPLLIKIDVQGYELHVLRGGEQTIKRARMLIVETSFETLYEKQPLFDDVYCLLRNWGFAYVGALDQLIHPQTGRVLQADSMFVR